MLFSIGPVELKLAPLNPQRTRSSALYPYASHEILGAAPLFEDMGDGERRFTISCVTFPNDDVFTGGLTAIGMLEQARASGVSQLLLRGDFTLLGFYLITDIQETGETLGWDGVAGEISLEIELTRAEAPFAASVFGVFGGLL